MSGSQPHYTIRCPRQNAREKSKKLAIPPNAISRILPHFNLGKVAKLSARYNKSRHIAAYCVWWHFKIDPLAKNVLF
jgi:hypothetical protein